MAPSDQSSQPCVSDQRAEEFADALCGTGPARGLAQLGIGDLLKGVDVSQLSEAGLRIAHAMAVAAYKAGVAQTKTEIAGVLSGF
jgi:hypothetical protein